MTDKQRELDDLFSEAYEELKRLAASLKREYGRLTLNPTGLVNEVWVKLTKGTAPPLVHKGIVARAMRQVLVDAARRHDADRRGAGAIHVTLDDEIGQPGSPAHEIMGVDEALQELAQAEPQLAELVELRFFGGLSMSEIADALGVSTSTVERGWRAARAWLEAKLKAGSAHP